MADSELLYRFESGLKPDARNQLSFMKAKNKDDNIIALALPAPPYTIIN